MTDLSHARITTAALDTMECHPLVFVHSLEHTQLYGYHGPDGNKDTMAPGDKLAEYRYMREAGVP